MKIIKSWLCSLFLFSVSGTCFAQVEQLTPNLIKQYGLDFSPVATQVKRFTVLVATSQMIANGHNLTKGALYLKDNQSNTFELISKTLNGDAAVVSGNDRAHLYGFTFDASEDLNTIVYISDNSQIVADDTADTHDVFIYNRTTQQTYRVQGNHPHQSEVNQIRISPNAQKLAFTSSDFGFINNVNPGGSYNVIYIYDLQTDQVSLLPLADTDFSGFMGLIGRISETSDDRSSFSYDGEYLFYNRISNASIFGEQDLLVYDFNSGKTKLIADFSNGWTKSLSDSLYLFSVMGIVGDLEIINILQLYDLNSGAVLQIKPDEQLNYLYGQDTLALLSTDKRFAVFYASHENASEQSNVNAGQLLVLDIPTGEIRRAFAIKNLARTHTFDFLWKDYCNVPYVLNKAFFQSNNKPCGYGLTLEQFLSDDYYHQTTQTHHGNVDSYNVQPKHIRFHNSNRYITFEANGWYIDELISFEDFPYKSDGYPDYIRHSYVVTNPFLTDLNLIGDPGINGTAQGGVYIWKNSNGRTFVKLVADEFDQGSKPTLFSGSIKSAGKIDELKAYSIEADDVLTKVSTNQIDFRLSVAYPWQDSFYFIAGNVDSLCIDLINNDTAIFVGPDKIRVEQPYDINALKNCKSYQIQVDGKPNLVRTSDRGWYLWRNNGQWRSEFIIGSGNNNKTQPLLFEGEIQSSSALTNFKPISIEATDVLELSDSKIKFSLHVPYSWFDGFKFKNDPSSQTCVSLTGPAGENIYIGPNRVPMPKSFDLNTLQPCGSKPKVETLGRPSINRSVDNGIFIWENAPEQWQVEITSADFARWVDIDAISDEPLTSIRAMSLEENDVFTVNALSIDARFRVRGPWFDGFLFTIVAPSLSCLSSPTRDMPIFIGPNRIEVGNSVNLGTLKSCR